MKQLIQAAIHLVLLFLVAFVASTAQAKSEARHPSSIQAWKQELQDFKGRQFSSLTELKKSVSEFQNKLADDENMKFEEKVAIRKQMYKLENQLAANFPPPQIIGFKKVPMDPANPARGYVLEPEYK